MTNANVWTMSACGTKDLPKDFYCLELIFNPCLNKQRCKDCPIRALGKKGMKLEKALAQVKEFTRQAKSKYFRGLDVHLIGGDSLENWTRFVDFCNGVWNFQKEQRYPIQITATTCGFCLDEEKESFLLENSWRLRLVFRWNGEAGRSAWEKFSVLKYHPMTWEVDYCVDMKNTQNIATDLREIATIKKRIALEFSTPTTYFEMLKNDDEQGCKNKLFGFEAHGDCFERLCTVDIHGENYPCRYFSPERLTSSSLRDTGKEFDKAREVNAACPVVPYFLRKAN